MLAATAASPGCRLALLGDTVALAPQAYGASLSLQSFEVRRRKARALSRRHPLTVPPRAPGPGSRPCSRASPAWHCQPGTAPWELTPHRALPARLPGTAASTHPLGDLSMPHPLSCGLSHPSELTQGLFCSTLLSAAANGVSRALHPGLVPSPCFFQGQQPRGNHSAVFCPLGTLR